MWMFYILFLVPVTLFVLAFLYETWLSFARLKGAKYGRAGYVAATWEFTHTLLVFAVVMLLMTFTHRLTDLANSLFIPIFAAGLALGLRAAAYLYIFYVRSAQAKIGWVDWAFAFLHSTAAVLLVVTVCKALWFIITEQPEANTQFFPLFVPGLLLTLAVCILPIIVVYRSKG